MTEAGDVRGAGRPLRHVRGAQLSGESGPVLGMSRHEAVSTRTAGSRNVWMGLTRIAPGFASTDHHHGGAETAVFVVSGNPVFVFAEGDAEARIEAMPGDYVFVPPFVPHREENPGAEEAVLVLARDKQKGVVVDVPSLWAPVEHGDG